MPKNPDSVMRDAEIAWIDGRVKKDAAVAPDTLYHYTDASGLIGVLDSKRFWATDTRFLNDSAELIHGATMLDAVLAGLDLTKYQAATQTYIQQFRNPARRLIANYIDTIEVFTTCFCSEANLLGQWRAYVGNDPAGGYALGFSPPRKSLAGWAQTAPGGHNLVLRKVIYDQKEQAIEAAILLGALIDALDTDPTNLAMIDAFNRWVGEAAVLYAAACKHPAFAEEKEWRVFYIPSYATSKLKIEYRSSNGYVAPYVGLFMPAVMGPLPNELPLTEVWCGPSPRPDRKKAGVRDYLDRNSVYTAARVLGSDTPLVI